MQLRPQRTTNWQLSLCVFHWTPNQIYNNCVSKLLHIAPDCMFLECGPVSLCTLLHSEKEKPPRCWLSNTGPALKKEIKWQIGEGGGESPPVPDSCLEWQKHMCQSGRVSVFSPRSTALTSPAARPEVCVGSTHIQLARNKNCGHQLLKIEQNAKLTT